MQRLKNALGLCKDVDKARSSTGSGETSTAAVSCAHEAAVEKGERVGQSSSLPEGGRLHINVKVQCPRVQHTLIQLLQYMPAAPQLAFCLGQYGSAPRRDLICLP